MRILADVHISPRTVESLRSLGHDVERVGERIPATAADAEIVAAAIRDDRIILTQDLDFSAIVALSGRAAPSVVSLRLTSSRIENVNERLALLLPQLEADLLSGAIVTVEDARIRTRRLPVE
jgi:predicted nuclease of predicted toxin-antitoxin system